MYEARQHTEEVGHELTDEEQSCIDKISSVTGLEYIAHGAGRIVMRRDDDVIKFARGGKGRHSDGKQQNEAEVLIGTRNINSPYLAEPLDWDDKYLWVKYPYITKVEEHPEFDEHDAVRVSAQIKNKVTQIDDLNTLDIRRGNVGVRDGKAKIIDYGSVK
jgi:hypothetical protein